MYAQLRNLQGSNQSAPDETPEYTFSYKESPAPQGKTLLHLSLAQAGVSSSYEMPVPIYVYVRGEPHSLGFMVVTGPHTKTADLTLPVRPDRVAMDVDHSLLAVEHQ
ncbi:MAG: hypothetical protein ACRD3D_06830 [Terriglobia bacterium]